MLFIQQEEAILNTQLTQNYFVFVFSKSYLLFNFLILFFIIYNTFSFLQFF